MPHNEERRPPAWESGKAANKQAGRPDAMVAPEWAEVYADAERWVCWTARRRWPVFAVNDQIWACSVADWETSGRRTAA